MNRDALAPIVDCVRKCGVQGIALRRAQRNPEEKKTDVPTTNDGNFKKLLGGLEDGVTTISRATLQHHH